MDDADVTSHLAGVDAQLALAAVGASVSGADSGPWRRRNPMSGFVAVIGTAADRTTLIVELAGLSGRTVEAFARICRTASDIVSHLMNIHEINEQHDWAERASRRLSNRCKPHDNNPRCNDKNTDIIFLRLTAILT